MGILANSASVTHSSSSSNDTKAGYVTNEQITLSTSPTQSAYSWGVAKPSGSTNRSALSDKTSATLVITPDVAGIYVFTEGTSGFILRCTVTAVTIESVANAHRLSPVSDASVPAPALGRTIYHSANQNELVAKDPTGNIAPIGTSLSGQQPVRLLAATTAALPAHTRSGNVLTATANGALPAQDGVTLVASDLLLVKDEGSGTHLENGVYVVTQVGSASLPWILTRAYWFDSSAEAQTGAMFEVVGGTKNKKHFFALATEGAITLNTTALTFQEVFGYASSGNLGARTLFGLRDRDNSIQIPRSEATRPHVNVAVGVAANFTGVPNQVFVAGHNAHPLQGREDNTLHEWSWHQEYEFEVTSGGARRCEAFMQFTSSDGGTVRRPIAIDVNKNTPYDSTVALLGTIGLKSTDGAKQRINLNDPASGQATLTLGQNDVNNSVILSFERNNVGIIQQLRADAGQLVELLRLDASNDLQIGAGLGALGGSAITGRWKAVTQISPTALSGDVNDYAPTGLATAARVRIDGGAANRNITGLALGSDGRILWMRNIGTTNNLVLKHESASSSAANRFNLPGAADFTLTPGAGVELMFDVDRWKVASS